MGKFVTMGEIMLRLSTKGFERFIQADDFDAVYGGGEANVAVSLASFGLPVSYVTKVPQNAIGKSAIASLSRHGVDTSQIVTGEGRLGIYFLEPGVSLRASNVIYDRKDSAISLAEQEEFDYEKIFEDASWFHFSGITPALSRKSFELTYRFAEEAKRRGLTISLDVNYRSKLWSMQEAASAMQMLAGFADVIFCSERDMKEILGMDKAMAGIELYEKCAERYGFKYIISSTRENISATHNTYSAAIYSAKNHDFAYSDEYDIDNIVDRVGGGDAMAAGVIYKLFCDIEDYKNAAAFGAAASALKHTIKGDFNLSTVEEVEMMAQPSKSTQINR